MLVDIDLLDETELWGWVGGDLCTSTAEPYIWFCTKPEGHSGLHVASDDGTQFFAAWTDPGEFWPPVDIEEALGGLRQIISDTAP